MTIFKHWVNVLFCFWSVVSQGCRMLNMERHTFFMRFCSPVAYGKTSKGTFSGFLWEMDVFLLLFHKGQINAACDQLWSSAVHPEWPWASWPHLWPVPLVWFKSFDGQFELRSTRLHFWILRSTPQLYPGPCLVCTLPVSCLLPNILLTSLWGSLRNHERELLESVACTERKVQAVIPI